MTGFEGGDLHDFLSQPDDEPQAASAYDLPYVPFPAVDPLGPVTVTLSTVRPEHVEWLWPGRLPLGKLVILDGDPSLGKSTLALDFAARVSTGTPWPDDAANTLGDALILSAEDGLADTIRPRLDAAGADPGRVHALCDVRYCTEDGQKRLRPPTLADSRQIEQAIRQHHARLVVVDVLMAYLPGAVDSHRDQDIRSVLSGLATVAEATRCCILLLRHLNKTSGGNPLYRGGGSIGIVGAARAAFLAAVDPDDESRRVLAATKCNLAPLPEALAYRLVDFGNGCARVEWEGNSGHSAADLLSHRDPDDDRDSAARWLSTLLQSAGGQLTAVEVYRAADAAGYSKDQAKRAKRRLHVEATKDGMSGGWLWVLPAEGSTEGSEGRRDSEPAPFAPFALPSRREPDPEPTCEGCQLPLDPVLAGLGERTHPTCEPWLPLRLPTREQVYATETRRTA